MLQDSKVETFWSYSASSSKSFEFDLITTSFKLLEDFKILTNSLSMDLHDERENDSDHHEGEKKRTISETKTKNLKAKRRKI